VLASFQAEPLFKGRVFFFFSGVFFFWGWVFFLSWGCLVFFFFFFGGVSFFFFFWGGGWPLPLVPSRQMNPCSSLSKTSRTHLLLSQSIWRKEPFSLGWRRRAATPLSYFSYPSLSLGLYLILYLSQFRSFTPRVEEPYGAFADRRLRHFSAPPPLTVLFLS